MKSQEVVEERDEREVVEVRQVSDVSGLEDAEERMKCGWNILQREVCSLFKAAGFSKDPDQPWLSWRLQKSGGVRHIQYHEGLPECLY